MYNLAALNHPLFSVVTVVYNGEKTIESTLNSVISQEKKFFEYIIIDGKSKDNTLNIVNKYQSNIDVVISEKDNGVYDAMQKSLTYAKGEYVIFMNSGDVFCNKDVLKNIAENADPNSSIIYGDTICTIEKKNYYIKAKKLDTILSEGIPFSHQSVFVKNKILQQYNFNLKYKYLSDFEIFRRMYINKETFQYIEIPISIYDNEGGLTYNNPIPLFLEKKSILNTNQNNLSFKISFFSFRARIAAKKLLPQTVIKYIRKKKYKKYLIG